MEVSPSATTSCCPIEALTLTWGASCESSATVFAMTCPWVRQCEAQYYEYKLAFTSALCLHKYACRMVGLSFWIPKAPMKRSKRRWQLPCICATTACFFCGACFALVWRCRIFQDTSRATHSGIVFQDIAPEHDSSYRALPLYASIFHDVARTRRYQGQVECRSRLARMWRLLAATIGHMFSQEPRPPWAHS